MKSFCTYFDQHYIVRGLTLYRSLEEHAGPFTLYVLCLDEFTFDTLQKLKRPNLVPIPLSQFEAGDTALLEAKKKRTRIEYFFTCSPSLPLYIFRQYPDIDLLSYVDADLFFVSSLEPLYSELSDKSVLIIGHRFPERLKWLERTGVFNVGFLSFRRDRYGLKCLQVWREQCLDWCYDRVEDERFADQKYLDTWPARFDPHVVVLGHKGANVAPWNWMNYEIRRVNGRVTIDGEPLIFYHFAGMKILNRWLCNPGLSYYGKGTLALRRYIYRPYLRALRETRKWVDPGYSFQPARGGSLIKSIARGVVHRDLLITIGNVVI
jgi:hypothetical protein